MRTSEGNMFEINDDPEGHSDSDLEQNNLSIKHFNFEENGEALVGFSGTIENIINSLNAYTNVRIDQ